MAVEPITIFNSINHALTIGKGLMGLRDSYNTAEAKMQIADLMSALAQVKAEIIEKDEENKALKEQLKIQGEMAFKRPYYYRTDGAEKSGPYCPKCFDSEKKVVNLHKYTKGWHECKNCDNRWEDDYEKSSAGIIRAFGNKFTDDDY